MSDIDTAAILEDCARLWKGWPDWPIPVRLLCNALDAARAEAEFWKADDCCGNRARADAAEARIAYLEGYAAAAVKEHRDAMDRINAALVRDHCVSCVHEALTGDPE